MDITSFTGSDLTAPAGDPRPWEDAVTSPQNGRSSITRTSPSEHLGACGHELDPWEAHLEHAPTCLRGLCIDDSHCTCPEVCPDCCRSCGYDTAERMGS